MRRTLIMAFLLLSGGVVMSACSATLRLDNPPPSEYRDSYIGGSVGVPLQLFPHTLSLPAAKPGLLAEVPKRWKHSLTTSVFTETTGITGTLIITDLSTFEPPSRGPVVVDEGYQAIVIYAADNAPATNFDFRAAFQTGTAYPSCFVLKAVPVEVFPAGPSSSPSFIIPPSEPDPKFPQITDSQHVSAPLNCAVAPPVVELASFSGAPDDQTVQLTWEATSEHANAGFNLYRAIQREGPYNKLNATLIPSQGSPVVGARYQFVDRPGAGAFFYKLENVSRDNIATIHGAIAIQVGFPTYLPLVAKP